MALNNLKYLICHKTKPDQTKPNQTLFSRFVLIWFYGIVSHFMPNPFYAYIRYIL